MIRKWGKGAFDLSRLKNISDDSYMNHSGCLVAFKVVTYHWCAKSQLVWFGILRQYRKFRYLPKLEKVQFQRNPVKLFVIDESLRNYFSIIHSSKAINEMNERQDWGH